MWILGVLFCGEHTVENGSCTRLLEQNLSGKPEAVSRILQLFTYRDDNLGTENRDQRSQGLCHSILLVQVHAQEIFLEVSPPTSLC